jgi:glutathione S-transferase
MRLSCSKSDHNAAKVLALMLTLDVSAELAFHEDATLNQKLSLQEIDLSSEPLYEVNSILRYIARQFRDKGYAGILPKEEA